MSAMAEWPGAWRVPRGLSALPVLRPPRPVSCLDSVEGGDSLVPTQRAFPGDGTGPLGEGQAPSHGTPSGTESLLPLDCGHTATCPSPAGQGLTLPGRRHRLLNPSPRLQGVGKAGTRADAPIIGGFKTRDARRLEAQKRGPRPDLGAQKSLPLGVTSASPYWWTIRLFLNVCCFKLCCN